MRDIKPSNYYELQEELIKKDQVISDLMKINFHRISENNYKKVGFLKVYALTNKIILNLNKNLIIVTPAKKDVAYFSTIFSTLGHFKKDFENRLNNFSNWLIEGNSVELCSAGDETGKIYKYLGKSKQYPNCVSLKSLDPHNQFTFHHKIKTLLQLCPTTKNRPLGKKANIPKPELTPIDRLLDVKSYGNSILYENKMIVLTDFFRSFKDFLDKETLMNKSEQLYDKSLNEIIKNGQIDEDGSIKNELTEPLLLYTRDLNSLYQYSSKSKKQKIVICDDIKKLNDNISIVNQIKENGDKLKFLIFAGESEFDHIKSFHKSDGADIWRFTKNEITSHTKNVPHDDFDLNKIASGRTILRNRIYCNKKRIPIVCEENILNDIHNQFDKIRENIITKDEETQNIIKEMTLPLYIRMFILRDHIFGFPEDLVKDFEIEKKDFNIEMESRKTTLDNEIWDHLVKLNNLFKQIPKYGEEIFNRRIDELKKILELREKDSKGSYAILVYKIKTKNYFLKKIKEKWNIDSEIICSIDTTKTFKNLIVPSELPNTKIDKLLLNNNFENIYFLGSKSFNEKINAREKKLNNRWQKLDISPEEKCKYIGLDNNLSHIFHSHESNIDNTTNIPSQPTIDLEKFFYDDKSSFFKKNISSENEQTTLAFQIVFNGDAYAYLTENFRTEVLNNVFDPSAFEKKTTSITKDWKNLKREDIIMIRDSVDKDVLDRESILVVGNETKYLEIKKQINLISETINNAFGKNFKINDIRAVLKNVGYNRHLGNVVSIANPLEGTICPNDFEDLEKIFKACAIVNSKNFIYERRWAQNIFKKARLYKNLRIKAGRILSQKLRQSIRLKKDLDYDGNPLRVDYINGQLVLGSNESESPEAWIVQINNFEEPKKLKEVPVSKTNKVFI